MSKRQVGSHVVLGALCTLLLCGEAVAQPPASRGTAPTTEAAQSEARERYARGVQLVSEGKYQTALIEMQRAYSLNPSHKILYNLGQIHAHLGDSASALVNYERYLAEGGADIIASRAAEVNQEITKLRPLVASVDLVVKGEGAEVILDDAVIGHSPFHQTVTVNAGQHKFSAAKPGAEPTTRVIPLAGADRVTLELEVGVKAAATMQDSPQSNRPGGASSSDMNASSKANASSRDETKTTHFPWFGWTLSAALGIGAGVAGYVTTRQADHLSELRDTPGTTRQALDDGQASTFRAALVTDVLLGATAIAAGVSLYYTLSPNSASDAQQAAQDLRLEVGPAGVRLRSSF